jgi:hypothetical protein
MTRYGTAPILEFGAQARSLLPIPRLFILVLTHEAIIDSTWDSAIQPLLLKRFPGATEEWRSTHSLTEVHYSGSGCYPFGSKFFTDLTHMFVRCVCPQPDRDSQDLNEYAFALGALSHYAADNNSRMPSTGPFGVLQAGPGFRKQVTYPTTILPTSRRSSLLMSFRPPRAATPPRLTRASSVLRWQDPYWNGRFWIPMG